MHYYDLIGLCPDEELDNLPHLIIESFISDLKSLSISDGNLKMLIKDLEFTVKALKDQPKGEQRIQYVPQTKWFCPECETWQTEPRTWENEEEVEESDGDDIPNYRCNTCLVSYVD